MRMLRDDLEKRDFWINVAANITAVLILSLIFAVLHTVKSS